ncbi:MAG: peptidylprolyl isomerase [bacterium]
MPKNSKSGKKFSKIILFSLFMFLVSFGLYGCAKKAAPPTKVLATVNGKPITVNEFKAEVAKLPPSVSSFVSTQQGQKRFLKSMVERQILADRAIKDGINKSKAYKMQLSDFKKGLLVQLLLNEKVQKKLVITNQEAKNFYKKHLNTFNLPSKINVSYIQLHSLSAAKKIYSILQKGVSFSKLAKKYSVAPNAAQGGILGWIKFGQTTPAFNQAAFGIAKMGGYSNIVSVGKNYDIIKLNNILTGKPRPFSKIKNQIIMIMKEKEGQKLFKTYLDKVKKASKVTYYYKNLAVLNQVKPLPSKPSKK